MSAAPLAITLLAALALPAPAAAAAWRLPVPGLLERSFAVGGNPYAGGQHRGIDLRAAPGTIVRAPCEGRVVVAERIGASGGVVTVLCGRWRASLLPLATITTRAGAPVARGAPVGTLAHASAHAGLHLGVRRDGTRFGYVDPLRFLGSEPGSPPLGPAPRGRTPRHPPTAPVMTTRPVAAPASPVAAPAPPSAVARPDPAAVRPATAGGLAPWPAWAGLALVLAGAGLRWRCPIRTRTRRLARVGVRLNE